MKFGSPGAGPASPLLFAPGPKDGRWVDILAGWPELAPAVSKEAAEPELRGVADELADWVESAHAARTHRLRAIGNGCVPLQVAVAFVMLYHALMAGREFGAFD